MKLFRLKIVLWSQLLLSSVPASAASLPQEPAAANFGEQLCDRLQDEQYAAIRARGVSGIEIRPNREIWFVGRALGQPVEIKIGEVLTLPAGTEFYHWGPAVQKEWAMQGFPNSIEFQKRISMQAGYFVTTDCADTLSYGPDLVIMRTEKPLQVAVLDKEPSGPSVKSGRMTFRTARDFPLTTETA